MIRLRHKRSIIWALVLGSLGTGLQVVQIDDWAGGPFQVRSVTRAELRAPVAAFVKEVCVAEGDPVSPGALVARLEVPDLASRRAQKQAEIREAQARLWLLEIGARSEEIHEQECRIERAKA